MEQKIEQLIAHWTESPKAFDKECFPYLLSKYDEELYILSESIDEILADYSPSEIAEMIEQGDIKTKDRYLRVTLSNILSCTHDDLIIIYNDDVYEIAEQILNGEID